MYLPAHFQETRPDVLHGLIRARPLGTLVTHGPDGLEANHLPFEIDPEPAPHGTLRAHVARANPVWRRAGAGEALVVFHGPQAYISPRWYPTKRQSGKVVPTWNYAVVHAYGHLQAIEDRAWLRALVARLTERHEAGDAQAWKLEDAPPAFIEQMLGAIVGLELRVTRLLGKWKVSQNCPAADRDGAAQGLRALGDVESHAMAALIDEYGTARPPSS